MTVWGAPAAAPVPQPDQAPVPMLVRSLLENTLGLLLGMQTCRQNVAMQLYERRQQHGQWVEQHARVVRTMMICAIDGERLAAV